MKLPPHAAPQGNWWLVWWLSRLEKLIVTDETKWWAWCAQRLCRAQLLALITPPLPGTQIGRRVNKLLPCLDSANHPRRSSMTESATHTPASKDSQSKHSDGISMTTDVLSLQHSFASPTTNCFNTRSLSTSTDRRSIHLPRLALLFRMRDRASSRWMPPRVRSVRHPPGSSPRLRGSQLTIVSP